MDSERVGTTAPARREGFLWVWREGSTLRRPEVTASPLESWSKTAPMSELLLGAAVPFDGMGGGGGALLDGNGGGGGAFPDEEDDLDEL